MAVGAAIFATAGALWQTSGVSAFLVCLALAAVASTMKIRLPGLTGTISPGFVFVLLAVGRLSWSETVIISVVAGLVQCLWRATQPPGLLRLTFNAATMAIAGGLAYAVAHGLIPGAEGTPALLLAAAGVVLLVSNTMLVSTIVCLSQSAPLLTVWRALQLCAVPYYLAGGVLASVWVRADFAVGAWVPVLTMVTVYLLDTCYRQVLERMTPAVIR